MLNELLIEIKGPEFWMSFAFFVILFISFKPLKQYLDNWGKAQAAKVQAKLEEPAKLREQAQMLLEKYEEHTKNRESERADMMKKAEEEIDFLQKEFDQRMKDRLERKKRETETRLQMIYDNGITDMKNQMLHLIVKKTYDILQNKEHQHDTKQEMEQALNQVYSSLNQHIDLVKK